MALFVLSLSLGDAFSQELQTLSDEQVRERLSFIETALTSAQPRAKTWWYGWVASYSAGAVIMGSLAAVHWKDVKRDPQTQEPIPDRGFAEDMLVGSATFALGVGGLLIDPFVPAYGPNRIQAMPESTPEDCRLKLQKAEELLRESAKRERDGRGWLTHLLNLGANAAAGLVTVLAFDRPWSDGLLTFATGEAVSLLNIYTQPRRAIRDLENYEIKYLGKQGAYFMPPGERRFYFGLNPGGFSLGMRF
ncbi:MAG TPA: hypothetical protein VMW46_11760 [Candidatus Desulfaltia sp.]|nr:hypothetical protein [Candidatus Desulfaltia sp.]